MVKLKAEAEEMPAFRGDGMTGSYSQWVKTSQLGHLSNTSCGEAI